MLVQQLLRQHLNFRDAQLAAVLAARLPLPRTTGLPTAALSHAPCAPRLNTRPSVLVETCVLLVLLAACSSSSEAQARQAQQQ